MEVTRAGAGELGDIAEPAASASLFAYADLNGFQTPTHSHRPTLVSLFAEQVRIRPDAVAIVSDAGTQTYSELNAASDRLAARLVAQGVGPGSLVGTLLDRSPEAITALLSIVKAGGAFVPFDPDYPANLLGFMLEDSAPVITLTQRPTMARTGLAEAALGNCIFLDDPADPVRATGFVPAASGPDDLAYVMYTSGSTGRPKGVMVPHRGITRLVKDSSAIEFGADQTFLQLSPLSFDASTLEVWGSLLNGGRLAIPPAGKLSLDDIADAIARLEVTTLWLTAGLFHLMVDHRMDALGRLRQLLAGGDVLSPPHVERLLRGCPECRFVNGYGPTENTTFTCCYVVPHEPFAGPIPIGRAIDGTAVHVLDADLRPVADGEAGQLCTAGSGVALGYLNQPGLTAERFVNDPFSGVPGARMYLTGDIVRRRPDGVLEFHGRNDRQLKINGKRVELDEIENVLRRSGLVDDAAVTAEEVAPGVRRILAYVTRRAEPRPIPGTLRTRLLEELPDYMVPALFVVLDELPLTQTGKVDRKALRPPSEPTSAPVHREPETGVQVNVLRDIWRKALHREDIGLNDNFFDLGGSSLQLIDVHAQIRAALQKDIPITELFRCSTIMMLAGRLSGTVQDTGVEAAQIRARQQLAAMQRARRAHKG